MASLFIIWISLLWTNVLGQYAALIDENNTNITKITTDTFAECITSKDLILAEFTVPNCPHSKMLLPDLEQVATILKPRGIEVIQINCEEDDYICSELKVTYFPTLRVFKNHRLVHSMDVEKDKSVDGLVSYMLAQNECSILTANNRDELNQILIDEDISDEYVVVNNGLYELNETVSYLANQLFNSHIFVNYRVDSMNNNTNTHDNNTFLPYKVGLYKPFNPANVTSRGEPIVFEGNLTAIVEDSSEFKSWLQYSILPLFADVKPETFKNYIDSKLPLGYYFYLTNKELEELTPFFTQLGQKYKGKINFIGLDAKVYHSHVKYLNMREQFPLFGIHDMINNRKYGIKQMPAEEYKLITSLPILNQTEVVTLVEDFINGVAEPIIKSEEIPTEQSSNVFKLVAKTHDDIVLNNSKDVIVRYYAPFDIRNKKGNDNFHKVADVFASDEELKSKVLFADINMQANDIASFAIYSYPTIILYPSGNDTVPITLSGPKTPIKLMKFLKNNGTHHADGLKLYFKTYPAENVDIDTDEEEQESKLNSLFDSNEQKTVTSQETIIKKTESTSGNHLDDKLVAHDEL